MHDAVDGEVISKRTPPLVLLVLALMLVGAVAFPAFLVGRSTSSGSDMAAATPPAQSAVAETPLTPLPAMTVADLEQAFGPAAVASIGFADGTGAFVVCQERRDLYDSELAVVRYVAPPNSDPYLLDSERITTPGAWATCEACLPKRMNLGGDDILYGECRDGGSDGGSTAYIVAQPKQPRSSALALSIRCGGTFLRSQGGRLMLLAHALKAGAGHSPFWYPPVGLEREDLEIVADDVELLASMCDFRNSAQLRGRYSAEAADGPLTYEDQESALGMIGVRGALLVGLSDEQCDAMVDAWWDDRYIRRVDAVSPIADLTGLDPPAGHEDWFYTCQR